MVVVASISAPVGRQLMVIATVLGSCNSNNTSITVIRLSHCESARSTSALAENAAPWVMFANTMPFSQDPNVGRKTRSPGTVSRMVRIERSSVSRPSTEAGDPAIESNRNGTSIPLGATTYPAFVMMVEWVPGTRTNPLAAALSVGDPGLPEMWKWLLMKESAVSFINL